MLDLSYNTFRIDDQAGTSITGLYHSFYSRIQSPKPPTHDINQRKRKGMNKIISSPLLIFVLVGSLVIFTGGCTKKSVIPPTPSGTDGSSGTMGKDINYPPAEGSYSENSLNVEGSLDDTKPQNIEHLGSMAIDGSIDRQSPEFKQKHGRSSAELLPIYFDFDQATVRPDMVDRMVQNAGFLQSISNMIIIEGNCDDRGTKEYNLALAERRAINVRDYLVNLGINAGRIRTVSYGEERPLFLEQDDFARSQNRRAGLRPGIKTLLRYRRQTLHKARTFSFEKKMSWLYFFSVMTAVISSSTCFAEMEVVSI